MTSTGSILVVDDERTSRELLSRRLAMEGHRVAQAACGEEALEVLESERVDLVMLDVVMPGLSGLETLQAIRANRSAAEMPVIMVTARSDSHDVVRALEAGANDYVTKPLDVPVTLSRVRTQLNLRQLAELKDEFLRIASHDLKNPIASVKAFAAVLEQTLKPGQPATDQAATCAQRIRAAATTMQKIVEDFLDFQAMQDGRLDLAVAENDLGELARSIVETNAEYAREKQIAAQVDIPPDLAPFPFDRDRIGQVVQNLVSNAIKFGPPQGNFTLRIAATDDMARLEVCDTGPGLTKEDLARTFVKYARLSNKPTGGEKSSGLGLAICKQIVELHGGRIGVRNNPDRGATFWFEIPTEPDENPA